MQGALSLARVVDLSVAATVSLRSGPGSRCRKIAHGRLEVRGAAPVLAEMRVLDANVLHPALAIVPQFAVNAWHGR